jgi:hypothetical protein
MMLNLNWLTHLWPFTRTHQTHWFYVMDRLDKVDTKLWLDLIEEYSFFYYIIYYISLLLLSSHYKLLSTVQFIFMRWCDVMLLLVGLVQLCMNRVATMNNKKREKWYSIFLQWKMLLLLTECNEIHILNSQFPKCETYKVVFFWLNLMFVTYHRFALHVKIFFSHRTLTYGVNMSHRFAWKFPFFSSSLSSS